MAGENKNLYSRRLTRIWLTRVMRASAQQTVAAWSLQGRNSSSDWSGLLLLCKPHLFIARLVRFYYDIVTDLVRFEFLLFGDRDVSFLFFPEVFPTNRDLKRHRYRRKLNEQSSSEWKSKTVWYVWFVTFNVATVADERLGVMSPRSQKKMDE